MNDLGLGWDVAWRLAAAIALGAAIGFERELQDQPAGLRTHLSVALGASVFGALSTVGFREFEGVPGFRVDPSRIASQVVVGIGFLGAGVIIRQGFAIHNVTTAASLWVTAAVGLAAGLGDIGIATASAAAMLFGLTLLRAPRDAARRRFARERATIVVGLAPGVDPSGFVDVLRALGDARVEHVFVEKAAGAYQLRARVIAHRGVTLSAALASILRRDDVVDLHPADRL